MAPGRGTNVSKAKDGKSSKCLVCEEQSYEHCVNFVCPIGFHNNALNGDLGDESEGDPLETLRTKNFELGQVSMQEDFWPRFRELSGKSFADGKTDEAFLLRKLAETFEKEAKESRAKFMTKYNIRYPGARS
jgi:hypothetical protein